MASHSILTKNYPSLVAVCHAAVKNAPSGLDARTVADFVSKPYQTLMSELSRQEGHKLGADLLLPIMDVTGSPAPMHFLARELGGVYVPISPWLPTDSELGQGILASVKEFGEFAAEAAKDIADGDIPREQLDRINKEGQEALSAILAFMELARKAHEGQYSKLNGTLHS